MGSLEDKINYLSNTKNLLYTALVTKGANISTNTPFRNYPTEVYKVSAGSSPQVASVGLRIYIDAIDNQGACTDERHTGLSNAYWIPLCGINNSGTQNVSSTYFGEDYCSLNYNYSGSYASGYYYSTPYPIRSNMTYRKDATLEAVFSVRQLGQYTSQVWGITHYGGYSLRVGTTGLVHAIYYVQISNERTYQYVSFGYVPLNKRIYCCFRIKEGQLSVFSTLTEQIDTMTIENPLSSLSSGALTLGYNGNDKGSPDSGSDSNRAYVDVSSARYYTRYISDEEMMNNYLYDKNRYNIKVFKKLTINPTPSDATVTLTATDYTQANNSISVLESTEVTYTVSKDGYETQTDTVTVTDNQTLDITLTTTSEG